MRIRLIVMMARRRHRQPVLNDLLRACQSQLEWLQRAPEEDGEYQQPDALTRE
jgi:hypothetical protein